MRRADQNHRSTVKLVELAVLTAIVLVMQMASYGVAYLVPTALNLVLIPIVIGAIRSGPLGGAWLGLVCGVVTLIGGGVMGLEPTKFTAILFEAAPFMTAVTCIVKATLAGLVAGLCYKLLEKKNQYAAVFTAAALAPIVNTGIFILCGLLMHETFEEKFINDGSTVLYFLVIGCAGINFIVEFLINMVFTPAIHRVILLIGKKRKN